MVIIYNFLIFFIAYFLLSYIFNLIALKVTKRPEFSTDFKKILKRALTVSLLYLLVLMIAKLF